MQGVFYRDVLQITTNQKWSSHGDARIVIDQYRGEDSLILNTDDSDTVRIRSFSWIIDNDNDEYLGRGFVTDTCCKVILKIEKFNTVEGIVSGTFEGSLIENDYRQDTIFIKKGRFDATM